MARFINTNRLDYLCLTDVFIRKEFIRLKKLNEYYNHRTAEFFMKNNGINFQYCLEKRLKC